MNVGNWQLDTVSGGSFRIDGGVMFGIVPKQVWRAVAAPDDQNRIPVSTSCVLARDDRHTVLIDCGYGGKHSRLDRSFYDMEAGEPLVENLAKLNVSPEDIDVVLLSHLHFDHLGGATQLKDDGRLVPTFPCARHFVGRSEWEVATSCGPELETAYSRREVLALQDTRQFSLLEDGEEIVPGIAARMTGGHTRGHLSFVIRSNGNTALYPGDICPSTRHLRRMWHLAYDVYPLDTRRNKPLLLGEAADGDWWILWTHDPQVAASRVVRDRRREFTLAESRALP